MTTIDNYDPGTEWEPDELLDVQAPPPDASDRAPAPAPADMTPENPGEGEGEAKQSAATRLVKLAHSMYELRSDADGAPYAVEIDGPNVALALRGGRLGLRAQLAAAYHAQVGKVPSAAALTDALCALEGEAALAPASPTALRVAAHDGAVVVDLGDPDGRAVVIADGTWRVVRESPVTFRRTALTEELPAPAVPAGGLDALRDLVNVDEASWPLLLGWLVASFLPAIPHPVLSLHGEMGTGKTTAAKVLGSLIDPSPASVRSAPREADSWVTTAAGSWVVAIDNVSGVPVWLSDALCRAVTGEASVRRQLYTDGDLVVTSFRRCVILTAIDAGALRGDLADRLVRVRLERIDTTRRRTDAELDHALAQHRPAILAALLDLVAQVLEVLPTVTLDELPRMADYARVLAAIDQVADTDCLPRYLALGTELMADVVDDDQVASAVRDLVPNEGDTWTGTATDLHAKITPERPPKGWPTTPRYLATRVNNAATALRSVGIEVTNKRTRGARLTTVENVRDPASPASPASHTPADQARHRDAAGDAADPRVTQAPTGDAAVTQPATPSVTTEPPGQTPSPGPGDAGDARTRAISHEDPDDYLEEVLG